MQLEWRLQAEGQLDVRKINLVHGQFVGVDQGDVDLALVHHTQQVDTFHGIGNFEGQFRILFPELLQQRGMNAVPEYQNTLANQIGWLLWPGCLAVVDDLGCHLQITLAVQHVRLPVRVFGQAGGDQQRSIVRECFLVQLLNGVDGFHLQADPLLTGKCHGQVILETRGIIAFLEKGGRCVASQHGQFAGSTDLRETVSYRRSWGRAGVMIFLAA